MDFETAKDCPSSECICNTSISWLDATRVATDGEFLFSNPVYIDVPSYRELELSANFDSQNFDRMTPETALYQEIKDMDADDNSEDIINHPINDGNPDTLPFLHYNPIVPSVI